MRLKLRKLKIALAGNANVGKSVIFNYLTGGSQHVGNWPGKTVEKADGTLVYRGYSVEVVDLPGIYSVSPNSPEERVAEEFIRTEKPDAVINVVDASVLERNLFLTLQLLEMRAPVILVLNLSDVAKRKGISVDAAKLGEKLGVEVVETVAVHGKGVDGIIRKAIALKEGRARKAVARRPSSPEQKYAQIAGLVSEVQAISEPKSTSLEEKIDSVALHGVLGYAVLALVTLALFFSVFTLGESLAQAMYSTLEVLEQAATTLFGPGVTENPLWKGLADGLVAALTVAIPFVLPFYILLAVLEDTGYLARMAFLADGFMHGLGLHGKAFIPLFMGYGCTVPACIGCRIIETGKERFQTAFLATLVPCAARSVIILGVVGAFMGWQWALAVYAFNLLVVVVLGRFTAKAFLHEPASLIMEMPSYRLPQLKAITRRSVERVKHFIVIAFPIILAMSLLIAALETTGLTRPIESLLSPVTVGWLGLPAAAGITLLFGIIRKELALIMLASMFGTVNFAAFLSPVQMMVYTLVMIFYIPCAATVATLVKEFGWKKAIAVTVFEISFAILLGGIAYRLLPLVM
ncbi:TPA: ferrous iron transporter B [Candidatus Micrarchaeota archaeon]|nr:MAG: hypothetical protein AUJ65_04930 [Candidatus Micrarchaeota archaeon CG1_02_51_15]HII38625.1 ferrous iron transporter B [Candidatus Micrarchaeota archaeon]